MFAETDWLQIGKDILFGIGSGLAAAVKEVVKTAKEAAKAVGDGIKDFFGIKSPSRLMRDEVGKYLAQGIGVGFTDEMKNVSGKMTSAVPTSFDVGVNASGTYQAAGGTSRSSVINIGSLNLLDKGDQNRTLSQLEFMAMI